MIELHDEENQFALQAVRLACQAAQQVQQEMLAMTLTKDDRSPVTVADYAAQAVVASLMESRFPQAVLVAEENTGALQLAENRQTLEKVTSFVSRVNPQATPETVCGWIDRGSAAPINRFWTLDPVDGTKGFLRGDQYAIALALIEAGKVQIGVLGCPKLPTSGGVASRGSGWLVIAVRQQGAWVTDLAQPGEYKPLHVSRCEHPSGARLMRSVEAGHTNAGQVDDLAQRIGLGGEPVCMDSQAKYAILAAGQAEMVVRLLTPAKPDYREKIWDQAAGSLIVEEAGGRVSDLDGKVLDFSRGRTLANNRGILASNGHLHNAALQALRQLGA